MKKLLCLLLAFVLLLSFAGCGKTQEAPEETEHIHIWKPATCTAPKTCVSCRITEGESDAHVVDIGTCPKCEKFQNAELIASLTKDLDGLVANLKGTCSYLSKTFFNTDATVESLMVAVDVAQPVFDENELTLERAIALCGDYAELASVKLLLEKAHEAFPRKVSNPTMDDLQTYNASVATCYNNIFNALLQVKKIA